MGTIAGSARRLPSHGPMHRTAVAGIHVMAVTRKRRHSRVRRHLASEREESRQLMPGGPGPSAARPHGHAPEETPTGLFWTAVDAQVWLLVFGLGTAHIQRQVRKALPVWGQVDVRQRHGPSRFWAPAKAGHDDDPLNELLWGSGSAYRRTPCGVGPASE